MEINWDKARRWPSIKQMAERRLLLSDSGWQGYLHEEFESDSPTYALKIALEMSVWRAMWVICRNVQEEEKRAE